MSARKAVPPAEFKLRDLVYHQKKQIPDGWHIGPRFLFSQASKSEKYQFLRWRFVLSLHPTIYRKVAARLSESYFMQKIVVNFENQQYEMELFVSSIGDKKIYTVLVEDPRLIPLTGRVISYLSDRDTQPAIHVQFSSENAPYKGRLKSAIAEAINQQAK